MISTVLALTSLSFALPSLPEGTRFGVVVSAADVNGDGFSDVIVGEPDYDGNFVDEGRVLVYLGSAAGPASTPAWTRRGFQARAHLGAAVAGLGDVNGDGFEDIAVGMPGFDGPRTIRSAGPGAAQLATPSRNSGAFVVFLGSPVGLTSPPALFRPGIQDGERVGAVLARAGDVNGDGFDDVLVGATGTDGHLGAAFVFHGAAGGPHALPDWSVRMPTGQPHARFASALAGNGDVNGDGFDDVVVGAPDAGEDGRGTAYVYHGSAAGLSSVHDWTLGSQPSGDGPLDNQSNDWGVAVAIVGDTNGDGFDEVLIADPGYDGDLGGGYGQALDSGVVFLFAGSSTGLGTSLAARMTGLRAFSIAGASDVNGDGRADPCFGGPGGGLCFRMSASGHSFQGLLGYLIGGYGLSAAGDLNGDGVDDVLGGDPFFDFMGTDTGVVYFQLGSPGGLDGYGQLFAP